MNMNVRVSSMGLKTCLSAFLVALLLVGCETLQPILDSMSSSSGSQSSSTSGESTSSSSTESAPAPAPPPAVQASTSSTADAEDSQLARNPTYVRYTFESDSLQSVPAGFAPSTVGSPAGRWEVVDEPTAPSPSHVVAQSDTSSGSRYTALLLGNAPYDKLQFRTRIKIAPGTGTQAAGILVHARDAGNGYAFIVDVKRAVLRLERVVNGQPLTIKNQGLTGILTQSRLQPDRWYTLSLIAKRTSDRCEMEGYIDGVKVMEERDNVFLNPEKCGIVVVNDTKAFFDNVSTNEVLKIAEPTPTPKPTATPKPTKTPKPSECVAEHKYRFDQDAAGSLPTGFASVAGGDGQPGAWTVAKIDKARSKPNVLIQSDRTQGGGRYSLLVLQEHEYTDFHVQCDLRTLAGEKGTREAGIVFRYQDPKNFYFAGLDTGADRLVLVRVANGERQNMENASVNLKNEDWYELKVRCEGMKITVELDDKSITSAVDNTYMAGKVGVFTVSDTTAQFDDLLICALKPPIR